MLKNIIHIYFLGIGGIGMSGLARWTQLKGFNVNGWDDNPQTQIIERLTNEGIVVHDPSKKDHFSSFFDSIKKEDSILVCTSAISSHHPILNLFKDRGVNIYKRADLLQFISKDYCVIAIAGTHGKTTISIMLAHILKYSGLNCNAFFGGISYNYDTNFMIGDSDIMVIEADEYDKSFLKLNPDISLISSLDKDHGDIYKDYNDMINAYNAFIFNTKRQVIGNKKLKHKFDVTYSIEDDSDFSADNISYKQQSLNFKIKFPNNSNVHTCLKFGSYYNMENAIAAAALAFSIGINPINIGKGLSSFKGVYRRLDYHDMHNSNLVLIDDYAHHPEELKALIASVKILHKEKELFLIFQPHLFSRTQEFENQFAEVLSLVDKLILLDIYPAREQKIPGVSSEHLIKKIVLKNSWHISGKITDSVLRNSLNTLLLQHNPKLVITAGAGNIYKLIPFIKTVLS